ncbi:hypothetical protein DIC82_14055 [Clostridium beijerinckii]|nr:hypothetical protein DIC82_14055 [Clostridium beijerinckii]
MDKKDNKRDCKSYKEEEFESIDEMDYCFDEKKDCFTDIMEEVYDRAFEKGSKEGYEKAQKQLLEFMKKNKCCIKCCKGNSRKRTCCKRRCCKRNCC